MLIRDFHVKNLFIQRSYSSKVKKNLAKILISVLVQFGIYRLPFYTMISALWILQYFEILMLSAIYFFLQFSSKDVFKKLFLSVILQYVPKVCFEQVMRSVFCLVNPFSCQNCFPLNQNFLTFTKNSEFFYFYRKILNSHKHRLYNRPYFVWLSGFWTFEFFQKRNSERKKKSSIF